MDRGELRTRCETRFRDITNIFVTPTTWNEHLNSAYREFYQAARWPFQLTSHDFVLPAGTRRLDLTDVGPPALTAEEVLEFIQDVYDVTGDRVLLPTPDPPNLPTRLRLFFEHQDSEPLFYTITGDVIYLLPAPTVDHTIRVFYHEQDPVAMTADVDVPNIPERYHEALVSGALAKAHADDANVESSRVYREEFVAIMEQAFAELMPRSVTHDALRRKAAQMAAATKD